MKDKELFPRYIQPCIIKNTSERRQKLESMGIVYDGYYGKENEFIITQYGPYNNTYETVNSPSFNVSYHTRKYGYKTFEYVYCGDNENLFFALAALRDDTDINQWFIMDSDVYLQIDKGDWFLATDIKGGKHVGTQIDPLCCHKATVEELIEHFKK